MGEKGDEFRCERGFEREGLVGAGVFEFQVRSVEEVALELESRFGVVEAFEDVRSAVEEVADDRVAEGLEMHADLVGAGRFRF